MAVMTIYTPLIFAGGVGVVKVANASQITITSLDETVTQDYFSSFNNFTYSGISVTGGIVTSTNLYDSNNGGLQYSITGLSHDAVTVAYYVNIGDADGLRAYLLNGNDTINGSSGIDILNGYGGTNLVYGNGGNDTIYGGNGVDSLIGGAGDDSYVIWGTGAVSIIEGSGDGNDSVTLSLGSFTLPDHVETLLLQTSADNGAGNSLDNLITGNNRANLLEGGAGNDTLLGGWDNDTLDGGSGNDVLQGGEFNDTYIIDSLSDAISDVSGIDTVITNVSDYTLGADIENLLLGAAIVAGAGNSLSNTLTGNTLDNVLDGADGNDSLFGESGGDTLYGGSGNDTLDGGAGIDRLAGGDDNDIYVIDAAADEVVELENGGVDGVRSSVSHILGANVENLTLTGAAAINGTGNALANVITGNGAANILDGGAGADTMSGGLGDDTYYVDDAGDVITDTGGVDIILLSGNYSLASAPTIENVTLTGSADINATGNALSNVITGNSGRNLLTAIGSGDRLFGMGGMDTLVGSDFGETIDGGAGADSMAGGFGFDTYYVDDAGDVIVEVLVNTSDYQDRVFSSASYVLPQYVEILTLTGDAAINGGGTGSITGNSAGNYLTGGAFSDQLYGMGGNDTLDGGAGVDIMQGGEGDDLYFVDHTSETSSNSYLIEVAGEGNDTIVSALSEVTLQTNFEVLVMLPGAYWGMGNALDNLIVGHASVNVLDGGAGADTMMGGAGNDEYRVDNVGDVIVELADGGYDKVLSSASFSLTGTHAEELWLSLGNDTAALNGAGNDLDNYLRGNYGNNQLSGGGGNDTLHGWFGGADTLTGGAGDDLYVLWQADDLVQESPDEGNDTIEASASFSLALLPHVENLRADPSATINLTGNALDNILQGNFGANLLIGDAGNDSLLGLNGNDTMHGDAGNDWLDGGNGYDTIYGGTGDDYIILGDWQDFAVENPGEGDDTVEGWQYDVFLETMPDVEHLVFRDGYARSGHGNAGHNSLKGNTSNNLLNGANGNDTLDGGGGADTLIGGGGDDTYWLRALAVLTENSGEGVDTVIADVNYVLADHFENLLLSGAAVLGTGNAAANRITGNSAGNQLDGGAGADTLEGGMGDDRYWADDFGDVIVEAAGGGYDIVYSSASLALIDHVEALVLTGSGHATASGNAGNNILSGNSGNNTLDGGGGADIIAGGPGNDTYVVDNSGDQVMELGNSGIDAVQSGVSYDLMQAWHVENLTLTGGSVVNGSGNWLDNVITGNSAANRLEGNRGNDTINGGGGSDTLVGGLGDDVLVWDAVDVSVQGGAGSDTLRIDGSGVTLDLTLIGDTLITDVEVIDLTGSGNNTLTLALADVLGISSTNDVLRVDGNSGDVVNAGTGWINTGSQVIGAQNYAAYAQGVATLLVDSDITVSLV